MILAEIHLFLLLRCFGCFLFNAFKKSKAKNCLKMQTFYGEYTEFRGSHHHGNHCCRIVTRSWELRAPASSLCRLKDPLSPLPPFALSTLFQKTGSKKNSPPLAPHLPAGCMNLVSSGTADLCNTWAGWWYQCAWGSEWVFSSLSLSLSL